MVAKYIALDGSPCPASFPCVAPNQRNLPGQAHVQVAVSPESFEMQYEFLMDEPPEVVDIVRQKGPVTISGRAVNFPANTGKDGATLDVWEVDSATGHRVADQPLATFEIGPSGDFGPITASPLKHYEFALTTETGVQHFYHQRFLRDSHLVRLQSGPPDSDTRRNTNRGPNHAAVIVSRMVEWRTSDVLEIGTSRPGGDQAPVNVIVSGVGISGGGFGSIGIHIHDDAASPGESSLSLLSAFSGEAFQTGVDLYMPAADPPDGTITLTSLFLGDTGQPQVINVPNWASEGHGISVIFSDFPQPAEP